ncbi:hypothetical protein C8R46DRAFT_1220288 [Mycena filopes]|nr:hypothetical protein C8R46DRAFT_1220288 [Mycena filopes]
MPGTVQWTYKATAVRKDAQSGKYTIDSDAWSRVSPLVWDAHPLYCSITFVETKIDMEKNAHLSTLLGNGTMTALSNGKGLLGQLNSTYTTGTRSCASSSASDAAECWRTSPSLRRSFDTLLRFLGSSPSWRTALVLVPSYTTAIEFNGIHRPTNQRSNAPDERSVLLYSEACTDALCPCLRSPILSLCGVKDTQEPGTGPDSMTQKEAALSVPLV